MVTYHCWII